jgi:hypothetical protein
MAANMAATSPGLETARLCSEFRSGNTTKQAATELADLAVTKFIGFSALTSAESAFRALPVHDIPAPSPSVAIAGQARSHGRGSYQVCVTILSLAGRTAPLWPFSPLWRCSWQASRTSCLGAGQEAQAGCL